jgi:GNAT superfamily N-acetyltransferase
MIVREATSDADYDAWTGVRNRVELRNPTTVEDLRKARQLGPDLRHWLAEDRGEPVGCVFVNRSSVPGRAFALPRVVPEARGRGVGSELLAVALKYARELGCEVARSHVDGADDASVQFAEQRRFVEVDRQVELVRPLAAEEPEAEPPPGIELAGLRPEQRDDLRALLTVAVEDMPVAGGVGPEFVDEILFEFDEARFAVAAVDAGELVGVAGLARYGARSEALEHAMTAVARSHRGRGIAKALKGACVHWAAANGYCELVTWTQNGNAAMQAVNDRLGFRRGEISITVEGRVP